MSILLKSSKNGSMSFFQSKRSYIAWFTASLFYFYQYILRVCPGMMIDDIRNAFSIKAEEFATLGSIYLIFYSILQIPIGIILDKVGVKKVILYSLALCITGSFIASISNDFYLMQISRAMIGIGSASAFMVPIKIIADNFFSGSRGALMGATLTIGTIGALFASQFVSILLNHYEWRVIWSILAAIGLPLLLLIFFSIPGASKNINPMVFRKE